MDSDYGNGSFPAYYLNVAYNIIRCLPLLVFVVTLSHGQLHAAEPIATWTFNPPTILTNILRVIERDGPREGHVSDLKNFINTHSDSKVTDEALLRLADIYLQKERINDAKLLYKRLIDKFRDSRFKNDALYGLSYCQIKEGRFSDARSNLLSIISAPETSLMLKARSQLLLSDANKILVKGASKKIDFSGKVTIGIILPLSGKYKSFGEEALKGIILASGVFGDGDSVDLFIKDSAGDPDITSKAMDDFISRPGVEAVVGPLLSVTAVEAAKSAQRSGIPVICLSQKDGLPETGDYIFRNFLTSEQQAGAISDFAMAGLGYKKMAILFPDNSYGRGLAENFKDEVVRQGGEIVGETSYEVGTTDFGDQLKTLFDIEETERLEGNRTLREYQRGIEADAIYIPDFADTIGLIAPQLAYYDIEGVTMLGSNGWNSHQLIEFGGNYVEGSYFVDGFFGESSNDTTKAFVHDYENMYGGRPGIIGAQAYDSVAILRSILKQSGMSRDKLRQSLSALKGFKGVTGSISFDDSGDALKDNFILTVKDARIVEVGMFSAGE